MHRHAFRQDAVLHETDHTVLCILVKFSWHVPDFPIYSNGTKPGTLQTLFFPGFYALVCMALGTILIVYFA